MTPALAAMVYDRFRDLARDPSEEPRLTNAENEILRMVAQGFTYRQIAEKRVVALKTVQNQAQNILAKLHMHTRYELEVYGIRHDLDRDVDPDGGRKG
jgi:DNA-binding NarL/FixJ family response regulator